MMKNKTQKIITNLAERIRVEYKPEKIVLYGSYAFGNPTEDSDIDLLIVKNTKKRRVDRFVDVKRVIYDRKLKIPVSPLVLTPKELKERLKVGDDFVADIMKRGEVLYEKEVSG